MQELGRHERGDAGGENVDHRPGNDLIDLVLDRQHSQRQRHQSTRQDGGEQPEPDVDQAAEQGGAKSGGQHHAFNGDVEDARTFTQDARESSQRQRYGAHHGHFEQSGQVQARARSAPGQKAENEQGRDDSQDGVGLSPKAARQLVSAQ